MTVRDITAQGNDWSTTATFRSEAKKISDAIQQVGLVKTADTGQIDWTTVVASGAAINTIFGYEIFRLGPDGAGAIFVKVEYGVGQNATQHPLVRMQTATGTDGAGVLTGTISTRYATRTTTNASAVNGQLPCLFSSDGSTYFWCSLLNTFQQNIPAAIFFLDKARAVDGGATDEGWIWGQQYINASDYTPTTESQMVNRKAGLASTVNALGMVSCAFFGSWNTLAYGNDLYFFPHFFANPQVYSASPVALGYINTEITKGTLIVVTIYGTPRTFYALGNLSGRWSLTSQANHGVALRWDA